MAINIDKASLLRAAAATANWPAHTGYTEICYDRGTGEVYTIDHADVNNWTQHNDPDILTVCCTSRHMSDKAIEQRIIEAIEFIDAY